MKSHSRHPALVPDPNEEDIRAYAYHLYQQSQCAPGHDLDNWLEAAACLRAGIPARNSAKRLHWYANDPESGLINLLAAEAAGASFP